MTDRDADTLETLIELVKGFQQDVAVRLDRLETKVDGLERDLEEVRVQVVGSSVRQDRIMAQIHNTRADIKVLTVEVRTGEKDFVGLKQRMERL